MLHFIVYFSLIGLIVFHTSELPLLHALFSWIRILCFVYYFFRFLITRIRVESFHIVLLAYFSVFLYSSIIHGSVINSLLSNAATIFCLLVAIKLDIEIDVNRTLRILTIVFASFVCINFFFILLYPDGLWLRVSDVTGDITGDYLIGGNRNQMGATLVTACLTGQLCYYKIGKYRLFVNALFLVSLFSVIIVGSKTSLLGVLGVFSLRYIKSIKHQNLFLLSLIAFYILFQIFVVFTLTDLSSIEYVRYFVEDVLGKDLSFSGRADIWENASLMIFLSPYLGYGMIDADWLMLYVDSVSPHNIVYSIILKGGLLLLFIFVILIITSIKQAFKYRTHISIMLVSVFFILLIMSIMEVYRFILYVYVLLLIYYSKYYITKNHIDN